MLHPEQQKPADYDQAFEWIEHERLERALSVIDWLADQKLQSQQIRELWQRLANDGRKTVREHALATASRLARTDAVETLPLWLNDGDLNLRRRAVTWLLVTVDSAAEDTARQLTDDHDQGIRLQCARWFGRAKDCKHLHSLSKLAFDTHEEVRSAAHEGLLRLDRAIAFLVTVAALRRKAGSVTDLKSQLGRFAAAERPALILRSLEWMELDSALRKQEDSSLFNAEDIHAVLRLADPSVLASIHNRENAPDWLREALVLCDGESTDPGAITRLYAACDDQVTAVRLRAVEMLARHEIGEPSALLISLLRSRHADVRRVALEKARPVASRILPHIRAALRDSVPEIRRKAYELIAAELPESSAEVWLRAIRDEDPEIRSWAIQSLVALPYGPKLREAWISALRSSDDSVRQKAALALAGKNVHESRLGNSYARTLQEFLTTELTGEDAARLVPLIRAVGKTTPAGGMVLLISVAKHRSAILRRAAVDELLAPSRTRRTAAAGLVDTDDTDVLRLVALCLAGARDPRGLIPLLRALDECPNSEKDLRPLLKGYPQVRQVRFLLRSLKEKWPSVKRFAARALIDLDSPEMIEPLLAATRDPDAEVQRAALNALARFAKHPEVQKRLIQLRDSEGNEGSRQQAIAMLLGMDAGSVIQPLLQATRDEDMEVQLAAVVALGKYAQRPEVYNRMIEIMDYGDISIRDKAIQILGENQIKEAVLALVRYLGNPFLKFRAQEALVRIGDRKGILAIKRYQIREKLYGKKKSKGPIQSIQKNRRRK